MMKRFVFGFLLAGGLTWSFANADESVFRGIWNVDGTNLVCSVWNCSTNRCLLPFSRSGEWFCWLEAEYRLHELDFPEIKDANLGDTWCRHSTSIVGCSPQDPDIGLFPLEPIGKSSAAATNVCIVKRFPLDSVVKVKSAVRQLETPEEPSFFVVRLHVWYLSSSIQSKTELNPNIFWSKENILLQPSDGKEEHTDVSSLVSPLFLDMPLSFPKRPDGQEGSYPIGKCVVSPISGPSTNDIIRIRGR